MKTSSLCLLALLALTCRLQASSEKATAAIQQLQTALIDEVKAEKPQSSPDTYGSRNSKAAMLPRMREILTRPDSPQFAESLSQIAAYFNSEAVLKSLQTLQEEIAAEKSAAQKAVLAELSDTLAKAGKTVREAKVPADLDGIIAQLSQSRQRTQRGNMSEEVQAASAQIEVALNFVTSWQNYLAAKAVGNVSSANNALQNLTNGSYNTNLIPRSEILALIQTERALASEGPVPASVAEVEQVLGQIHSLDDIEPALATFREMQRSKRDRSNNNNDSLISNAVQSLQPINKTYQEFKAGLAVNLQLDTANYGGNNAEIGTALYARLRADLQFLLLPAFIGLPAATVRKPGENVPEFLGRLVEEAKAKGDAGVGIRAREALRLMQRGGTFSGSDQTGINAYVSGQNQETAGQFALAVSSYQAALRSGSDLVPSKFIGERLAHLKATHAEEYATGMEQFLNPPIARPDFGWMRNGNPNNRNPENLPPISGLVIPSTSPASIPPPPQAPTAKPAISPTATPQPSAPNTL